MGSNIFETGHKNASTAARNIGGVFDPNQKKCLGDFGGMEKKIPAAFGGDIGVDFRPPLEKCPGDFPGPVEKFPGDFLGRDRNVWAIARRRTILLAKWQVKMEGERVARLPFSPSITQRNIWFDARQCGDM